MTRTAPWYSAAYHGIRQARDLDDAAGVRGLDELAVADVEADVADARLEEDQVAGLELVARARAGRRSTATR